MKQLPNILVLASYANDTLLSKSGEILRVQRGGPALFIQKSLKAENFIVRNPLSSVLNVSIRMTDEGEFGKVPVPLLPTDVDWKAISEPVCIISTILDEINMQNCDAYRGKLFLDVQGYVRDGTNFGQKKYWKPESSNFYCVKATAEEVRFLPKDFVEKQKQSLLLVTDGSCGSTLFVQETPYRMAPKRIVSEGNTIGAGDTLFAYFISQLLKNKSPLKSLSYATQKTSEFLASKAPHS